MKSALILFTIAIVTLTACQKKPSATHCYLCYRYRQVASSFPNMSTPTELFAVDTLCDRYQGWIDIYEKEHDHVDTTYLNDSNITTEHYTSVCGLE